MHEVHKSDLRQHVKAYYVARHDPGLHSLLLRTLQTSYSMHLFLYDDDMFLQFDDF